MQRKNIESWRHSHTFGQESKLQAEHRTSIVVVMTVIMMIAEVAAGIIFGSMALLADGLHMASHAAALGINVFAYSYARRHATDQRFSFGTGKVNALGGFTGAVLLGVVALIMVLESSKRLVWPVAISFDHAIGIAFIGLFVNGISVWVLNIKHESHGHKHAHHHDGPHPHRHRHAHEHDPNLRSAYLHVLADALTSILAIFALLMAKYFGFNWMDPGMGILGAILVCRWAMGLLRTTGRILLDQQGPEELQNKIRERIESDGDAQVTDLHLWSIGPQIYSAIISVVAHHPKDAEDYKKRMSPDLGLVHITIETSKYK